MYSKSAISNVQLLIADWLIDNRRNPIRSIFTLGWIIRPYTLQLRSRGAVTVTFSDGLWKPGFRLEPDDLSVMMWFGVVLLM